ncbi:MAG: hypothetical protein HY827_07570 [Actinobacteria bacterium]|nr:hypothetical protein [Actinomycetota bacterium]
MTLPRRSHGQALVELIAVVPFVIVFGLLCCQALMAGSAYVYADNAAHAAALAEQLGRDGRRAARDSLPGWSRGGVRVRSDHGRVDVWLTPRAVLPPLSRFLTVHSRAFYVTANFETAKARPRDVRA